jgi:hypothetical protein
MMTNRPVRPQAFRSSGRLLPGPRPVQVMRTTGCEWYVSKNINLTFVSQSISVSREARFAASAFYLLAYRMQ